MVRSRWPAVAPARPRPTHTVSIFANGVSVASGHHGETHYNVRSWLELYLDHLEEKGIDPTTARIYMPGGDRIRVFRTDAGDWNWEFEA